MNLTIYAKRLASLGHENRLELFQLLVQAGRDGMSVGELQSVLNRPASTLAFHLRELVSAGLVTQEKEGRMVRCRADYRALNEVLQFIRQDCCKGVSLSVFRSK
ncbi:MAG TPA: metalloregulator ArsR/SmtB family transcription factor [Burkholderiaceae bacterium]|jgi:DNA-binding transcriptional ArsR family regulator|nr:metalloregulator ArsR/SmtB family transcription factor [Burkholderiaceae bacterium]